MNREQAQAVAQEIVQRLERLKVKVEIHRAISHPIDSRPVLLRLVIGGEAFFLDPAVPDDFFAATGKEFVLSQPVNSLKGLGSIRDRLLDFLDEVIADMDVALVPEDDSQLVRGVVTEVRSIRDIGLLTVPCKVRCGMVSFSVCCEDGLTLKDVVSREGIEAIWAVAE